MCNRDFLFNSNPYALPRVLMGKALLRLPGLLTNSRTGLRGLTDDDFRSVILSGINNGAFTSWVWFYHYGKDGIQRI